MRVPAVSDAQTSLAARDAISTAVGGDEEVPSLGQYRDRLLQVLDLVLQLATKAELDDILSDIAHGACSTVNCERASVFLVDEARQELFTRVVTSLEVSELRMPLNQGIAGWVVEHRECAWVPDVHADPRWSPTGDLQTGFQTCNLLAVPLLVGQPSRLVGVLQLINKRGELSDVELLLARVFASHASAALERRRLLLEARQMQALTSTLETARKIQVGFLPRSLPMLEGYELAVWWQPAEYVSGDYYDWLWLPGGQMALAVGDVCGHGVPASLIMASVRAMFRALVRTSTDAQRVLELLADVVSGDLQQGRFFSLLCLMVDFQQHCYNFANAGHQPALHYHFSNDSFRRLQATALPIGFPQLPLPGCGEPVPLQPGDLLILGTDGVLELKNSAGEMFGVERLQEFVRERRALDASDLLQQLSAAIQGFHDGPHPPDDCTLVVLQRKS